MVYDAGVMIAFGFLAFYALYYSTFSFSSSSNLGLFLSAWGEAISIFIFGIIMAVFALLATSSSPSRVGLGGALGAVFSTIGALLSLDLVQTMSSHPAYYSSTSIAYTYSLFGIMVLLFAGFPLGLVGSLGALKNSQVKHDPETESSESKSPSA